MAYRTPQTMHHYRIEIPIRSAVIESLDERARMNPLPGDRLELADEFVAYLEGRNFDGGSYGIELDWWLHTTKGYTDSWIEEYLAEGYVDLEGNKAPALAAA